jgi:hypothetical protein
MGSSCRLIIRLGHVRTHSYHLRTCLGHLSAHACYLRTCTPLKNQVPLENQVTPGNPMDGKELCRFKSYAHGLTSAGEAA